MKLKYELLEQLQENRLIEENAYEKLIVMFKREERRYYECLNGTVSVNDLVTNIA